MKNLLIKGENIEALEYLLNERQLKGKVDLVYIDPHLLQVAILQLQMGEHQLLRSFPQNWDPNCFIPGLNFTRETGFSHLQSFSKEAGSIGLNWVTEELH